MFAHAGKKTTQRTRQEKRPASLRASVITRGFIAARKMAIAFFEVPRAKGAAFIASPPQDGFAGANLGHRPRIHVMKKSSSGESAIYF
jgi:hypothetical protein